jgi:hypothetical protein
VAISVTARPTNAAADAAMSMSMSPASSASPIISARARSVRSEVRYASSSAALVLGIVNGDMVGILRGGGGSGHEGIPWTGPLIAG